MRTVAAIGQKGGVVATAVATFIEDRLLERAARNWACSSASPLASSAMKIDKAWRPRSGSNRHTLRYRILSHTNLF
jgi:hypothetical protein